MMRLCSIMCFSSSIICLLIFTSHGSAVPGRHLEEDDRSGATSRMNNTQHRHDNYPSSSDLQNTLNSSHNRQKDLISYNEGHNSVYSDSSTRLYRNSLHKWRKQRSTDVINLPLPKAREALLPEASPSNNHVDHSHQPARPGSSKFETLKQANSHNHHGHSHNESEDSANHKHSDHEDLHKLNLEEDSIKNGDDSVGHTSQPCLNGGNNIDDSPSAGYHQHYPTNSRNISASVWLYATIAVVIISLCGLLSVAVIPIMQKWFYHTLLQFLVGLAVGSLSGDGLLHLMPHAILEGEDSHDHDHDHDQGHHNHTIEPETAIWRGLVALGGIFLFFIAERLLGALTTYRRQKREAKLSRHTKNMIPVMQREDDANNGNVGEKLAQPKKNSYDHIREKDEKETIQMLQTEATPSRKGSSQSPHEVGFHGRSSFSLEPEMSVAYRPDSESSVIVSDHHGHNHGHSHEIPQSVSAVAWMVIMGDGLHNFCDGLAIGAAFASGDADGISTTVAVFCHELPHELGDFAMLLKTGMKVKQALFYNGLSSILCFVGMLIGVSLGNVNSATNWVFAGTAGMFLYIALVDMLPELTSGNESGAAAVSTLAVQVFGIAMGISVMLLIAIYERKLHSIVS